MTIKNTLNSLTPEGFGHWVIRWRWAIILASLALVVSLGSGARLIQIKNDYRVFFGKDNPQLVSYETLRNIYTKDDNVIFVVSNPQADVFSPQYLDAVGWLTGEAWKLPYATRVDSITNYQHSEAVEDDLMVGDLVPDPANTSTADLEKAKAISFSEPLIYKRLVGDNPAVTGVNLTLTLPEKKSTEAMTAANAARDLAERFEQKFPGYQVRLTGIVMLNNSFGESSINDMSTIMPLMYIGIFGTMAILLRSVTGTISAVLVIIFSVASGMGLMGWLGIPLTPVVSTAPTMIMTLAVADSIHLLVTFLKEMSRGRDRKEAIVESIRVNFQPLLLTTVTTAIGFLSMNFSDSPPFRHLGNVVAMGVVAAWVFTLFFLPAFLSFLPVKVRAKSAGSSRWLDRLADVLIRRRPIFLWGSASVTVLLAFFITRIELNDQWVEYFSTDTTFRQDTDFAMDNLTGIYSIDYSIPSGETSGISNPSYLEGLDAFAQWYREQPGVQQVVTLSDTMKRLNKNLHGDDPAWYVTPDERNLAAQYLLLYEMSLPYGLDVNNQINVDKSASRFSIVLENLSTKEMQGLIEKAELWQKSNFPEIMQAEATSPSVMFAYLSERNIKGMLTGTALAVLLISFILALALRSSRYGLISLIPNFVPAILGFGLWGLIIGEMGLSLSAVTGMTLGIVVDDTVHFLSKYLRGRREHGLDAEEAVRFAFSRVGEALVITTIILVFGFGILSLSTFRLNAWMGQLTAIVIAFALVADFLLLPALLLTFDRKKAQSKNLESTKGNLPYENEPLTI